MVRRVFGLVAIGLLALTVLACGGKSQPESSAAPTASPLPTSTTVATVAASTPAPAATFVPLLSGAALITALRGGGYNLVFRHGLTDMSQTDDLTAVMANIAAGRGRDPSDDCSLQRNLSQAGRDQARTIGNQIERLGIPYAKVLTSSYCRTQDTAGLAFGHYQINGVLTQIIDTTVDASATSAMHTLLATKPPAGSNVVMVTHIPNILAVGLPSISEGDCLVLQPDGSNWTVVAVITVDAWAGFE